MEVNRENYLGLEFMNPDIKPEDDLGAEIEMDIPPGLRHPKYPRED